MFGRDKNSSALVREDTVDPQGVSTARVKVDMNMGSLNLKGGAGSLMDAHFEYIEGMEPDVAYRIHGERGELRIDQPGKPRSINMSRNKWDMRLNDEMPIDLEIDISAGEVEVDASTLTLTSFELEQAAGQGTVRLHGDQSRLSHVDIDLAAGKLELDMYGNYPAMRDIRIESAAGQVRLDLAGTWGSEVYVKVEVVAGEAIIRLPSNVNVQATIDTTVGRVKAHGLMVDGNRYRIDVPGATSTMIVKAVANVGQVVLEVVD